MEQKLNATFHGLDGFAGFRHGQAYELSYEREENDGRIVYLVQLPHRPDVGPARFSEKQWAEWWQKA